MKKLLIIVLYVCVLFRPLAPVVVLKVYDYMHESNSANHSWLVMQLVKQQKEEKEKIPSNIKSIIETSPMIYHELFTLSPPVPSTLVHEGPVVNCKLISKTISPTFQPPELSHS